MPEAPPTCKHVLIPTDGSDRAERGVSYGLSMAEDAGATVHAMYVIDATRFGETPALSTGELSLEAVQSRGEDLTAAIARRARDRGLEAQTSVRRGRPDEEIVAYADEAGVDVIVMGRSGEGAAEIPHVGSVTNRVLRSTDVPVFPV